MLLGVQIEDTFRYKLCGEVKDVQNGIVEVYGFSLHVDEDKIPNDINNGAYIEFEVPRVDIW